MTARELFVELEEDEGKKIYFLRLVMLSLETFGVAEMPITKKQADAFHISMVEILRQLWEGFLSQAGEARILGTEGMSHEQIVVEINRVTGLVRDFLNSHYGLDLPERKIIYSKPV